MLMALAAVKRSLRGPVCLFLSLLLLALTAFLSPGALAGGPEGGSLPESGPVAPVPLAPDFGYPAAPFVPYVPSIPAPPVKTTKSASTTVQTSSVVPFTVSVAKSEARIRSAAGLSAGILLRVKAGEQMTVLGQTTGTDQKVWYRVQYGSRTGYIRYDQVEVLSGTAQLGGSAVWTGLCVAQTNTAAVNVRLGMSTSSSRVRQLRCGQTVTVIGLGRDAFGTAWYYVCLPSGAIGYIRGDLITVVSGSVPDPAAQTVTGYELQTAVDTSYAAATSYGADEEDTEDVNGTASADSGEEELLYLRYLTAHLQEYSDVGTGYQGYTLYDMDRDGVCECVVNFGKATAYTWQILTCERGSVVNLGQLRANGCYLSSRGDGLLLVNVLSDSQTQYQKIEKVADSLVTMYILNRSADDGWAYTWTYNLQPISTESLLSLLQGFTDDVLQNMGLYQSLGSVFGTTGADSAPQAPSAASDTTEGGTNRQSETIYIEVDDDANG